MADLDEILKTYQQFPQTIKSLMLSTVDSHGQPNASYAPFVMDSDRQFYIFASGLSPHTANLLQTQRASILLIEDEAQTNQVFARRRLTYDCTVMPLKRDMEDWNRIADYFSDRFGEIIAMLRQLGDFQILRLSPTGGRFVVGFGAAYQVDPNDLSRLIHLQGS
jgi:putative heme iron utilization protein